MIVQELTEIGDREFALSPENAVPSKLDDRLRLVRQVFGHEYLADQPQTVVQFARYGILGREGEFAIADLRQFLNDHGESYKREISPFLRGDMPPELLPEVPDMDVLSRLFEQ